MSSVFFTPDAINPIVSDHLRQAITVNIVSAALQDTHEILGDRFGG